MTAQRPRRGRSEQRVTRLFTVLAVAAGILRSRRFHEPVIVGAIVLAALAGLGRENQARAIARIVAWSKSLDQRAEHALKRAGRVTADALEQPTRHG